ncbi:MAG: Phosphate regulon sensor protein PhoR [Pseudomonadota bacterium]|jgi:two-component system phosphate regulon sensor histidine kinase PhoR
MIRRLIELLALTAAGGSAALAAGAQPFQVIGGAGAGAMLWMLLDERRLARLQRWLGQGRTDGAPDLPGDWGEMVERIQRGYKLLERGVRTSEQRLEQLMAAIQASPGGVVVLNSSEQIEVANEAAAAHLGFDARRDIGQYMRNLVRDPGFVAYLAAGNYGHPVEIVLRVPETGQFKRISLQVYPYGLGKRLMLTHDISSVELAEAMRRDFVANVSHEIRTPLTVLSGFVETMLSLDLSPEERERYLMLMNQQAQRMMTLVNDLLLLSRLEGTPGPGTGDWMPARDLLDQVVEEAGALSDFIADGGHDIEAEPGPAFEIAGSRAELLSAMSNLLSNAVRYTPAGGGIRAGWRLLEGGGAQYYVTDTGPGIAPEHIPRLTERFYRVDRSRSRETGGTGLGLAIVKHVVQRHGGQLRIESVVGRGSTFSIVLPASRMRAT